MYYDEDGEICSYSTKDLLNGSRAKKPEKKIITITIEGGVILSVDDIPKGVEVCVLRILTPTE